MRLHTHVIYIFDYMQLITTTPCSLFLHVSFKIVYAHTSHFSSGEVDRTTDLTTAIGLARAMDSRG